jgi:hypothetical protein
LTLNTHTNTFEYTHTNNPHAIPNLKKSRHPRQKEKVRVKRATTTRSRPAITGREDRRRRGKLGGNASGGRVRAPSRGCGRLAALIPRPDLDPRRGAPGEKQQGQMQPRRRGDARGSWGIDTLEAGKHRLARIERSCKLQRRGERRDRGAHRGRQRRGVSLGANRIKYPTRRPVGRPPRGVRRAHPSRRGFSGYALRHVRVQVVAKGDVQPELLAQGTRAPRPAPNPPRDAPHKSNNAPSTKSGKT